MKRQGTDDLAFAKNLKRLMNERNLSVRALAEMAGVKSPSVIMSWLSNANPHDLQAVGRLAKALNMNFKELLLGENDQTQTTTIVSVTDLFDVEEHSSINGFYKINMQRLVPKRDP